MKWSQRSRTITYNYHQQDIIFGRIWTFATKKNVHPGNREIGSLQRSYWSTHAVEWCEQPQDSWLNSWFADGNIYWYYRWMTKLIDDGHCWDGRFYIRWSLIWQMDHETSWESLTIESWFKKEHIFLTQVIMDILRIQNIRTMRLSVSNVLKVHTEEHDKLPKCIAKIGALRCQFAYGEVM